MTTKPFLAFLVFTTSILAQTAPQISGAAGKRPFTFEDMMALKRLSYCTDTALFAGWEILSMAVASACRIRGGQAISDHFRSRVGTTQQSNRRFRSLSKRFYLVGRFNKDFLYCGGPGGITDLGVTSSSEKAIRSDKTTR
jgi:hypothetical protein